MGGRTANRALLGVRSTGLTIHAAPAFGRDPPKLQQLSTHTKRSGRVAAVVCDVRQPLVNDVLVS